MIYIKSKSDSIEDTFFQIQVLRAFALGRIVLVIGRRPGGECVYFFVGNEGRICM